MRIGLLLLGVNEKCGGAERFFADFFLVYNSHPISRNQLFLFTEKKSLSALQNIGKLKSLKNVICLKEVNNRFKSLTEAVNIIRLVILNKIDIIHITSYGRQYYSRVKVINSLPSVIRPKIILNIVDCELPYIYNDPANNRYNEYKKKYSALFNNIKIDGVYSWYKLFKEFSEKNKIIPSEPYIACINSRFADVSRFRPDRKKKKIVWAARMIEQKRPFMFVEAIAALKNKSDEIVNWEIEMYGSGYCELKVRELIQKLDLENTIKVYPNQPLENVFSVSSCFVSTQNYENFPSMSMMEAMAAGNVIIARNVGQTELMVRDHKNGLLLKEDTANGLAETLKYFIEHPELHESMAQESIHLTREVHTPENFIKEIDKFWNRFAQ